MIRISNFKLGMFIVVGTALATILIVMFGAGAFSSKGLLIETYIDGTVQGLDVGSPLKYRGVTIGKVTEIGLVDRYYPVEDLKLARIVMVRMQLDPKMQRRGEAEVRQRTGQWVEQGMRLRMASQGITGISFMEADFIKNTDEPTISFNWKPVGYYVPSARSQFARLADSIEGIALDLQKADIPKLAGKVDKLLTSVDTAVADADIKKISSQLQASLARIDKIAAQVDQVIADPKVKDIGPQTADTIRGIDEAVTQMRADVTRVTDSMTKTLEEGRATITDVRQNLNQPGVQNAIQRADSITRSLESTLLRAESSLDAKDEKIDEIITDMRTISTNLRDLTELISQYPSLAAFGTSPKPSETYKNAP